tara:strand:- start:40 stop:597 length:558 start_codon:yes stop_codon:yes gene_type:complete
MATQGFGASFGDPSKYMGQSPLADIGKALKIGTTVYGLEKSGLRQRLDDLGIKQKDGKFSFGSTSPAPVTDGISTPVLGAAVPSNPTVPVVPSAAPPPPALAPAPTPAATTTPVFTPAATGTPLLNLNGPSILKGEEHSVKNPDDFNPAPLQSGYPQQLAGDYDYQLTPGYGNTVKKLMMLAGIV